jgi:hypothetical protein
MLGDVTEYPTSAHLQFICDFAAGAVQKLV